MRSFSVWCSISSSTGGSTLGPKMVGWSSPLWYVTPSTRYRSPADQAVLLDDLQCWYLGLVSRLSSHPDPGS
jgi:hypothetical protein